MPINCSFSVFNVTMYHTFTLIYTCFGKAFLSQYFQILAFALTKMLCHNLHTKGKCLALTAGAQNLRMVEIMRGSVGNIIRRLMLMVLLGISRGWYLGKY